MGQKKKKKPLVLRKSVSIPRLKKQSRMKYSKRLFIWIQTHSKGNDSQSSTCTRTGNESSIQDSHAHFSSAFIVDETMPKVSQYVKGS